MYIFCFKLQLYYEKTFWIFSIVLKNSRDYKKEKENKVDLRRDRRERKLYEIVVSEHRCTN